MRKIFVFVCTGMMILGLTGCRGRDGADNAQGSSQPESTVQSSAESTQSQESQPQSSAADQAGQQETAGWSQEMEAVKAAVVESLGESYWPNMAIMPDMLEEIFGITGDMYDDYMAEMPMIGTNVDTLLIIRAKDDKVKEVEEALNAYRDKMVNDTMQYPMNLGKIQASRIERIGNYVCFVQLGADTMAAMESGDEAVVLHCQEQNELVIEVISQKLQH